MSYTVRMQVVQSGSNLMGKLLGAFFRDSERTLLKIAEKITTVELFHDDVDVVLILKDIQKANNVRVLTHLEDLDLSALKLNILD